MAGNGSGYISWFITCTGGISGTIGSENRGYEKKNINVFKIIAAAIAVVVVLIVLVIVLSDFFVSEKEKIVYEQTLYPFLHTPRLPALGGETGCVVDKKAKLFMLNLSALIDPQYRQNHG